MKLLSVVKKDALLLWRDKMSLLLLFLLPMFLLLFITITNPQNQPHVTKINILVANQDQGAIAKGVLDGLKKSDSFNLISLKAAGLTSKNAVAAVAAGKYQGYLRIPAKTTSSVKNTFAEMVNPRVKTVPKDHQIHLVLDPGLPKGVEEQLKLSINTILTNMRLKLYQGLIEDRFQAPKARLDHDLVTLKSQYAATTAQKPIKPNAVQKNVPGWTLFGMFFVVVPLASTMVKERELRVVHRHHLAPVWESTLLLGKLITFLILNQIQLTLMLFEGIYALPYFGLPRLELAGHWPLIYAVGVCASMAAIGFGFFMGSLAKTQHQATVVGPFIIVIGAAIAGLFAPFYLLPKIIQDIGMFSPLQWAHQAFINILVRNADLQALTPYLKKLLIFAGICIVLALIRLKAIGRKPLR